MIYKFKISYSRNFAKITYFKCVISSKFKIFRKSLIKYFQNFSLVAGLLFENFFSLIFPKIYDKFGKYFI